ncbi:Major facilitator superfamily like protein [Argiope bruennichi]|uniref:Major facilitator superfamily like protein n=1 Tax=Argiope bruennichi TaxID=94029 RepID=A0A8T0E563_ARGBR|nr:Major facilitator superfamily like protein [Argiope bruennichi]
MDLQRVESLEFYDRIPTEEIANEESQIQQMCCHINKKMFRFKMHYFLLTGGLGLIHPFLAVIARDRLKLSASSFASVLVFEQFLFVCTKPAIGYITDYFNKLKTVLCIIAIGQVLFFFILLLLPPIPDGTDGEPFSETHNLTACNLCENSRMDENKLKIFENTTGGSEARKESHYYSVNASNSDEISRRKTDFETYQFWVFALVFITLDTCINVIFTLSDTACCENMGKKGADYGKQRLWGSFAWGLLAPVGGAITDFTGDYIVTGILFAVLSTIMIWNILKMDLRKPQFSKDILKKVGTVMKEKEFLCFELGVFVNGIGLGFIWFYLMWFIISIGGNRLICGLTQTVQSFLGEIPFMFFSGWMLKRLGYWNVMMLSLLAYCVRFLWYSQLHSPWMALPIDWTHGVTYGVFYASLATYAKVKSKRGTETTMQAVIAATHDGLGAGIGNIIAGVGFDYIGAQKTFLYTGICFGCCAIISLCAALLQKKKNAANAEI